MDAIKDRLTNLENVIENLVSSLKKIEEVQKKDELYSFTTQQLIKWLNDNEVEYKEHVKDRLVDIIWKNINEWEWEYYYEDESESEPESEPPKKKNKNKKKVVESSSSEEFSDLTDSDDDKNGKSKKMSV
jgi:hypothetical protein